MTHGQAAAARLLFDRVYVAGDRPKPSRKHIDEARTIVFSTK